MSSNSWMVAMTFRLPSGITEPHKHELLKKFMRELMDREKITVAYTGVYSPQPNPHIHLAIVYTSKEGRVFKQNTFQRWEARWDDLIGYRSGGLVIEEVYNAEGWEGYMYRRHRHPDVINFIYNNKLLKKFEAWGS